MLTPGIPEYLTGSSKISSLIFDPPSFFVGIVLNICLYSAGVLLIREFSIRFNKGWASILALGCAYGIMEEGIAVHTFFKLGQPAATLSIYGRFAGVNWVWAVAITVFHATFSVALPILLLRLAHPESAKQSLLGKRGIVVVFLIYLLDVILLNYVVTAKPIGAYYVLFIGMVLFLIIIARYLPNGLFSAKGKIGMRARRSFVGGLLMFSLYVFFSMIVGGTYGFGVLPPVLDILFIVAAYVPLGFFISSGIPPDHNTRHIFMLCLGAIIPLLVWAAIVEVVGIAPLIVIVMVIAIAFLIKLRGKVKLLEKSAEITI